MGYHGTSDMNEVRAHAARSSESELVGVYEISKLLASPRRIERTLSSVLMLLSSFLDMRHGLITLLDDKGEPEVVVGPGWSEASPKAFFSHLPRPAICRIIATKTPLVIENVASSDLLSCSDLSRLGPSDGAPLSLLGVPIKEGDAIAGVLTVVRGFDARSPSSFDRDLRFLTMVANLIGQTLRLHKLVACDRERLMQENARLRESDRLDGTVAKAEPIPGILGESPAILGVVEKIRIVAKSRSTVLLRGETGVGKEVFAAAIHNLSARRNKPFIKLNCAALSESVLESELFGHERGSFTGAMNLHKGRFELADGGTLFLDEIGEITPAFQAKLLRVLQEGEFERVGGVRTIKIDVRLVCATNRDLEDDVQNGKFRADLYYRISVVPILIPPLRERKSDIGVLAGEFLERFNKEHGLRLTFSRSALDFLSECSFPGNIRELENYVTRAATLAPGDVITDRDISRLDDPHPPARPWRGARGRSLKTATGASSPRSAVPSATRDRADPDPPAQCSGAENCAFVETDRRSNREKIIDAMEQAGWVKAKAARLLGLTPRQIGYAVEKYGVPVKKF